jgi:CobQ-like glutamine amidotransferase family enzyme
MKIEVLFPEICNLYGDLANIRYLKACLPEAEIIHTPLQTKPAFLEGDVDLVYMGTTTENGQILALEQLRFYREQILDCIRGGQRFLVTGNAMELFGERIEEDGEEVCRGLGLFAGIARRSSVNRFNSLFVGSFSPSGETSDPDPIQVVGFKSQFGHMYAEDGDTGLDHLALFTPVRGPGMNRYAGGEGIRIERFLATYVIGPLLILNPPFTRWFLTEYLGAEVGQLAYEEAAMDSYRTRLAEYTDPKTGLYYWGGTTERWT